MTEWVSATYVYAIAAASIRLPANISGFGGPLYVIPYGEIAAVTSQLRIAGNADSDSAVPAPTTENLLRHEAVVEAVRASGAALPVRFGTALASGDEVTRALARHYDALRDDVRRVGDKIEVGISVLWQSHETPDLSAGSSMRGEKDDERRGANGEDADRRPGLAYMRARQVAYRKVESARERAQALAREIDQALQPHALEWRRSLCPSDRLALRDQYLLERERLGAFEKAFDELRQRHQESRFLLSGPWPPYNFVTPLGRSDKQTPAEHKQTGGSGVNSSGRATGALSL